MYGNWSKSDITTRISNLNTLTIHEAHADWSNWPKTITITVDGKATTHKTLRDAMHTLMDTDLFYEDREPETTTTTTEIKEEETMKTEVTTINTIPTTTKNTKEDTTMKTTNPVTIDLTEGVAKFELNGTTYTMNPQTNRYAKTVNGKTTRIGKAEYEAAKVEYDQQVLDDQPSHVEVENDLEKPAKLNEFGCVDCSKCNVEKCVHRDCMRRNPRNVGGLGECPRLDNGIMGEGQKIAEEEGIEPAEAELEANIRAEQKKPRKARKSKDIAYEGNGVTLTAKQVDFLLDLKQTDQWEGLESKLWTDVICDEIEGQFAGKPMTVGAMISTLCEKGLAERFKGEFTDPVTNRTRKSTYMELTPKGWEIAKELGL